MGLRVVEAWLVARLLSSPAFHRVVRRVHGRFTGVKHEEHVGGTQLEGQENSVARFIRIYKEEFKNEFRRK